MPLKELKLQKEVHEKAIYEETKQQELNDQGELAKGLMTGYEPESLINIELKKTCLLYGNPGIGLQGSSFSKGNINAGAEGELNFAKVLQKHDYLDKFASFWSVQYLEEGYVQANTNIDVSGADIDSILITKDTIYLIDVKFYSQGNITWHTLSSGNQIQAIDNATGKWFDEPRSMSENMMHATEHIKNMIKKLGFNYKVQPFVVMMPTSRGMGKIENVYWPGNVKCMTVIDYLDILSHQEAFNTSGKDARALEALFESLIKDETGTAIKKESI